MFLNRFYTTVRTMSTGCPTPNIVEDKPFYSFEEAAVLCEKGYFMTHSSFDPSQSMHYWGSSFYYEDGANLTESGFIDSVPDFLKEGWRVKFTPLQIDSNKLSDMHRRSDGYMLMEGSYEDCKRC